MKTLARSLALLLCCGCLKAGSEDEPKGGADVVLIPSAGTTGTPFVTPDGWTITVHKMALRIAAADTTHKEGVTVDPNNPDTTTSGGPGPSRILTPSVGCHLRISGATVGDIAAVGLILAQVPVDSPYDDYLAPCGVDDATLKRFGEVSEDSVIYDTEVYINSLPSFILDATATKDGKTLKLEWAVGAYGAYTGPQVAASVPIAANEGAPVSFPVSAELLFLPVFPTGVTFGEIATADLNGDGTITGLELDTKKRPCVTSFGGDGSGDDDGSERDCTTILGDFIANNIPGMFGKGASP